MTIPLISFITHHYPLTHPRLGQKLETKGKRSAFILHANEGQYVVKLTDPGRLESTVQADVGILETLAQYAFPAPVPVKTLDGKLYIPYGDRYLYLYTYLEGACPSPQDGFYRRLGLLLARLHSLPLAGAPTSAYQPKVLLPGIREYLSNIKQPAHQPYAAEMVELIDAFPSFETLPLGIIHTDPYFVNLLEDAGGTLYLIDWDDGGVSYPLLDLSYVIAHLCSFSERDQAALKTGDAKNILWREDWAREFLEAYQSLRPFSKDEKEMLPWAIRISFLEYIQDWETGGLVMDNYRRMKIVEQSFNSSYLVERLGG